METHGNTVSWTDDGVTAWASTQGISSVRDGLAGALQLDQSKVRVITEFMGGGFGAKFGAGAEGVLAAQLSREAKAPVRLMLTRFDQALAVGNRPSSFQKIKMGALADGTLARLRNGNYGTAGIGAGGTRAAAAAARTLPCPIFTQGSKHPREAMRMAPIARCTGFASGLGCRGQLPLGGADRLADPTPAGHRRRGRHAHHASSNPLPDARALQLLRPPRAFRGKRADGALVRVQFLSNMDRPRNR